MKNIELEVEIEIMIERKIQKGKLESSAVPPLLTNQNTILFLYSPHFVKYYKIT